MKTYNNAPVILNPAWEYHEQYQHRANYPRNKEPKYMALMPSIEVYFSSLKAAINYTKDHRRINGQRRRDDKRSNLDW